MCEALRELMKDEIDKILEEATAKATEEAEAKAAEEAAKAAEEAAKAAERAMEKGMEKGADNTIITSVRNLMETMKLTAEQAMDAIKVPMESRGKYLSKL